MKNIQIKNNLQYLTRKFVNHLMVDGKKENAEKIFLKTLSLLYVKEKKSPLVIFLQAIENTKPLVEIRSARRGGATYQIPIPVQEKRAISLGIKWLLQAAKKRGNSSMVSNLSNTFLEASRNLGESVKKKESIHQIALKNRSFTHFRWF